ncbi:MAG: methylated-DNA--[protein]-cysteine S-methyltransferase [Synergistes sp.]|nr:methylated-DNA--[protein]-cysteine S-methyltransferase [Synergistes sp.]
MTKNYMLCSFDGIGKILLEERAGFLTGLFFERSRSYTKDNIKLCESDLLKATAKELNEYFSGIRRTFDVPIAPEGTTFQMRCWEALLQIPYGETRTYGDIARTIGSPKGFRAVGMANNRNPIAIIIPCHRVIGADGSLTGFGGGLEVKNFLLSLEKKHLTKK